MSLLRDLFQNRIVRAVASVALSLLLSVKCLRFCFRKPTPALGSAIFITGAGSGIGRATALLLNSKGYNVFAGVISHEEGVALKADAENRTHLTPIVCDVTNLDTLRKAASQVEAATDGKLWGLVNNAGINYADGPVEFVPLDRVRRVFEVNVMGIYNVCQTFLPMVRASKGRVVNIASVNGFFTWSDHTPYCVSKHGVEALTDGLRIEMHPFGVHVSVVEPGGVKTPIFEATVEAVRACQEEMGEKCWKVYGRKDMALVKKITSEAHAKISEPIVVARAITHALTSSCPKMRYTIAKGAGTLSFLKRRLLSDGLFHILVTNLMGRTRKVPPQPQHAKTA